MLLLVGDVPVHRLVHDPGPRPAAFVRRLGHVHLQRLPFSTNWKDQWVFKAGGQVKALDWLKSAPLQLGRRRSTRPGRSRTSPSGPARATSRWSRLPGAKSIALNLSTVIAFENEIVGTGALPDLSSLAGQPLAARHPELHASASGYTSEAGLAVTY